MCMWLWAVMGRGLVDGPASHRSQAEAGARQDCEWLSQQVGPGQLLETDLDRVPGHTDSLISTPSNRTVNL